MMKAVDNSAHFTCAYCSSRPIRSLNSEKTNAEALNPPNKRRKELSLMNNIPVVSGDFKTPRELAPFIGKCPRLLPGESEQDYSALFRLMMDEIDPQSVAEWMVGADIVALFWDIERYRAWKGAILNTYRVSSLEAAFRTTNRSEPVDGDVADLFHIARKQAEEWRTDPVKREVLKSRLLEHGYEQKALTERLQAAKKTTVAPKQIATN
jgi:hypothetical protein